MRLPATIAILLLAAGGLAGCFGSEEEPTTPASSDDGGVLPDTGIPTGTIKVLAPLTFQLSTTSPDWVKAGTMIDVAASAPAAAKGDVTYTWAIGPLPGTVTPTAQTLDTGSAKPELYIEAGKEKALKFEAPGTYEMHCHPHAWMRQNVTVVEGYQGPSTVHVNITDGAKQNEYVYAPATLVIGPGTTVVYHNAGTQPHTATLMTQGPALKLGDLAEASGMLTVEGEGWQRVVAIAQDKDGRIGVAEMPLYVTATLPAFTTFSKTFTFAAGGVPGVQAAPDEAEPPQTEKITLAQGGKVFLNFTGADATTQLADFEIHLTKQGATQDTVTGSGADGALTGAGDAGVYTLSVKATGGVQPEVTVTLDVVYDLIPPEPTTASAGGDDGHGDHAGH